MSGAGKRRRKNRHRRERDWKARFPLYQAVFPSDAAGRFGRPVDRNEGREIAVSGPLAQGDLASVDVPKVAPPTAVGQLERVLDSPEIRELVERIEALRWTGRPGFGARAMVAMMLAKSIYALPTWSRAARLVAEHPALQAVVGCAPSQWACYRFHTKLREHSELLADALDAVLASLRERLPEIGRDVAIDGSDLPAYANGMNKKSKPGPERAPGEYSDP